MKKFAFRNAIGSGKRDPPTVAGCMSTPVTVLQGLTLKGTHQLLTRDHMKGTHQVLTRDHRLP